MNYTIKNPTIPLDESYDVIVCGGGPAGCTAAAAPAREGAKFACEKNEINIHAVDTQRLRKRLTEEGAYLPKLDTDTFWF